MRTKPHVVSIKISSWDDVFDSWDPESQSLGRLDHDWLQYVLARMEHLPSRDRIRLVLQADSKQLSQHSAQLVSDGIRHGLEKRREILTRRLRDNFKMGRKTFALGILILIFFMTLSVLSQRLNLGSFQELFHEGFMIIGWVALWRPVETLLYDWWPIVAERKNVRRLLAGPITLVTVHD